MKGSRFSEEQIIGVLREHEAGARTEEVCRRHGISSATFYKWKSKYGDLEVSEARRLKALEDENRRLKKLLAGLTYTQIADALGIHVHTLLRKRGQHEAFAEALRRGRAKGISAVANKLWDLALAGNVIACIFFLKCRGGWREFQEVDESLADTAKQSETREAQFRLVRAMTMEERQTIREINQRANQRLAESGWRVPSVSSLTPRFS